MNKIISVLIVLMLIVGCSVQDDGDNNEVVIVNKDTSSYDYIQPYESGYGRFNHLSHAAKDYIEIGKGLVDISKKYFPTDSFYLKEGSIISNFRDDYQPLVLLRESTENPYGLNPERSISVKVNKTTEVTGPILLSEVYEVDFVGKKDSTELAGAAFAIVLNKTIYDENQNPIKVDDEVLYKYGTETAGPKLESYLRKKPELTNVPIVIGIYISDSANDSVPGNYIAEAEYKNRQGQFTQINHEWGIFPTPSGQQLDGLVDSQITNMKKAVSKMLPEDVGIVAYGEFIDKQLINLNIHVNAQTKSYTEVEAVTNYIAEIVSEMETSSAIRVEIKSLNTLLAVIVKGTNSSSVEIIMM